MAISVRLNALILHQASLEVINALAALGSARASRELGVFDSPLLRAVPQGWMLR